MNKGKPRSKEE
jgi:hypothetical protein